VWEGARKRVIVVRHTGWRDVDGVDVALVWVGVNETNNGVARLTYYCVWKSVDKERITWRVYRRMA
jgi:hypothetical protein